MHNKKTLLITIIFSAVSFVAVVGALFIWQAIQSERKYDTVTQTMGVRDDRPTQNTQAQSELELQVKDSTALQNGLDTSRQSQKTTPSIPGPETFGQYDQFKTSTELRYVDLQTGAGTEAATGKKVAVYYKGWLTNGTLFDASAADDTGKLQPFIFQLGGGTVIKGWDIGVNGMKVGGVRRLVIPPGLGYGAAGAGNGIIPPDAVLVFDVQLIATE